MNEETPPTYTAREIVLELFPATSDRLVPSPEKTWFEVVDDRTIILHHADAHVTMTAISPAGDAYTPICCDVCLRSSARHRMRTFRVVMKGSQGRRYRYTSLCADYRSCQSHCISDAPVKQLLSRLGY